MKRILIVLVLGLALMVMAACSAPADPTPPVETPTTEGEAPATDEPTDAPETEPTDVPQEPVVTDSKNPFMFLLGSASVPEGWMVQACQGDGPFLCISDGETPVGLSEFSIYPIETMPEFQAMLADAGVPSGLLDLSDAGVRAGVIEALHAFAENYHTLFEHDRQIEYGDDITYSRLETADVMLGDMPGVRYGFAGINADGSTYERWVSFVGYDGDLLYIQVAFYRPDTHGTFLSDAELLEFLPHLEAIVEEMHLPLPVLAADVTSVIAQRNLDIFRSYAMGTNPVGQIAEGETVSITGVSPNQRHWRVDCPEGITGNCWIEAGAGNSEPTP